MSKPPDSERRRRRRVEVALPVLVRPESAASAVPGTVVNLSECGALVRADRPVEPGGAVRLVFEHEAETECRGRVARVHGAREIGVEFSDGDVELRGFVRRLLDACRDLHRHAESD